MSKTGFVSLIDQNEFIEWLKSKKYSYITIANWVERARILARKGLLNMPENELENEFWEGCSKCTKKTYLSAHRRYWEFKNSVVV
ncbi:phage antirepressor YoqD-like protein [Methanococcus maripaludis]|uniref:Phage antirepressor YoqD-like protein n=1 Tax=Methanococcus maripaludis TaxID=39152 RepID=A0A7J9NY75_METMI|nr:hypothetical protein [Methanococcus maripaludis]MBA2852658.1 phage antirepressor YoqD-like protein [Methanococcus maripaludis]